MVGLLASHELDTGELGAEVHQNKLTMTTTVVVMCIVNPRSLVYKDMT
jgi:hypothetical protein